MGLHHQLRPPATSAGDPAGAELDRTVAETVEVYHRTYSTLLRSTGETRLRVLEPSHRSMGSSLHPLAASDEPDLGAFLYACRRLPEAVFATERIVMGQSTEVFARAGFDLEATDRWSAVAALGRRRRWYHDGAGTLAVLMASDSDVDDLVPTLVAFQIEWNKVRDRLRAAGFHEAGDHDVDRGRDGDTATGVGAATDGDRGIDAAATADGAPDVPVTGDAEAFAAACGGRVDDWAQLVELWGDVFTARLQHIAAHHLSLRVRMIGGTQVGYARVTRHWWRPVVDLLEREGLSGRPVHFVSSNSHSVVNLVTGTVAARADRIERWTEAEGPLDLREELTRFREGRAEGDLRNFLYHAARLYFGVHPEAREARGEEERRGGVYHVRSGTALDVAAQVIVLDRLDPLSLDPRLQPVDGAALRGHPGVIVNIDYPLGLAAYNILREVAETVGDLRSVHILGKAATMNAAVGDVMLSNVVHDEHSGSTFFIDNAFTIADLAPHLRFGSGLDNQRAVTVRGTFLQNRGHLDFYYREAFTVVEMEAGPYCQAVYEVSRGERYPVGEPVNFSNLPIDLGIIHYASDTPFTQARTLGARGLSYHGMDSTYASSVAIVRRILALDGVLREPAAAPAGVVAPAAR